MEQIGRYVVDRELGRGGMARALLAHASDGRVVVLKIPIKDDVETCARIREEARVGIRVSHPNLIQTLDLFDDRGLPVLVLAFVDGASVHTMLEGGRSLPADAVAFLGAGVAGALHAIHTATNEHGEPLRIVHRDVSVGNILVDREGDPRLIDLGLARSAEALHKTQTGMLLGTLPYFAPELLDEAPYTPASDFWALGCVLYEAATGERLFAGKNEGAIVGKIMLGEYHDAPGWARIAPDLRAVLEAMLIRAPGQRLADGEAIARKLFAIAGEGARHTLAKRVRAVLPEAEAPFRETTRFYLPEELVVPFAKDTKSGGWQALFDQATTSPEHFAEVRSAIFGFTDDAPLDPELAKAGFALPSTPRAPAGFPVPPPSGAFRPPPMTVGELELERPRVKTVVPTAPDLRPTPVRARRTPWAAIVVVGVAIAAGAAMLVHEVRVQRALAEVQKAGDAAVRKAQDLERLIAPPDDAPPCWSSSASAMYVYVDARGNNVVKEHIEEVPRKFRRTAKCIPKQ